MQMKKSKADAQSKKKDKNMVKYDKNILFPIALLIKLWYYIKINIDMVPEYRRKYLPPMPAEKQEDGRSRQNGTGN